MDAIIKGLYRGRSMTREKAIKEYVIPALKHTWNEKINKEVLEALEQEPITKNNTVDFNKINELADFAIKATGQRDSYSQGMCNGIEYLRAVLTDTKPKYFDSNDEYKEPKKGHWIDTNYHHYYNDGDIETTELRCSCCNEEVEWDIELLHKPYYCENCGAKMVEPQESEEVNADSN